MTSVKEIAQKVCGEVTRCIDGIEADSLQQAVETISAAPRIFLAGAGRSGLAVRALAMRLMHLGKNTYVVGDTTTPALAAGDLLIIGSGSGRTASLLASAEKAKTLDASLMLATIDTASPIAALADCVIKIDAPSPKAAGSAAADASIQPMGSMFEQTLLLLFDSLVVAVMELEGKTSNEMFARHANLE